MQTLALDSARTSSEKWPLKRTMRTATANDETSTLAGTVAGEDLQCGDYVAVLSETYEFPSFFWCSDGTLLPPDEPVRMTFQSRTDQTPRKVKAICLPFVFVRTVQGAYETLDVRRQRLARLDRKYAEIVYKALRRKSAC